MNDSRAPLHFTEISVERPWGGRRLEALFGKRLAPDRTVGEIWLISDHPLYESRVAEGPHQGRALHELLVENPASLLGRIPAPARSGRFPLLLKLLDVAEWLSVQVHPNDDDAERLGEADDGKTEMWHILDCEPRAEILCGATLDPAALPEGRAWLDCLHPCAPAPGDSFFVPPGTVHAIGPGIVLSEIQQTSDLTYRVYDWERDSAGRKLHLEQAAAVCRSGGPGGLTRPVALDESRTLLCACAKFAAERVTVSGAWTRQSRGDSFHLLLNIGTAALQVEAAGKASELSPGAAVLIPGVNRAFSLRGNGLVLDYYVPDLVRDIAGPLRALGLTPPQIAALGCE